MTSIYIYDEVRDAVETNNDVLIDVYRLDCGEWDREASFRLWWRAKRFAQDATREKLDIYKLIDRRGADPIVAYAESGYIYWNIEDLEGGE